MKTILVATDFSITALNAVKYAADMSVAINADLVLLHVYQVPVSYSEVPIVMDQDDIRQIAEKDLNELKNTLLEEKAGKLNIRTEIRIGSFFPQLKAVCEMIKPYAVVIGSQGKTAAERFFLGGHAVYAMRHLMWPLITVPLGVAFSTLKKIGLACDFNDVVEATPIDEIILLVNDFKAELHLLNTGKQEVFDPGLVYQSGLLRELLEDLKPQYHFINNENIDEGLIDFAEKNQLDLLIILPKRHGLMDKLIHKSHTKQLVLHSHVPVMALHQQ